jgi:LPXTG-site transpeptidase (sortase) family protein
MLKLRKTPFSKKALTWGGILLIIIGVSSAWWQVRLDNTPQVLVGSGSGADDPDAFMPPLQLENPQLIATVTSKAVTVDPNLATPTAQYAGGIPDRLAIEVIHLDAPILPEHFKEIRLNDQVFIQWRVPFRRASGWHDTSAKLGVSGNTVLNGHHNQYGEVFKGLVNLKEGDIIRVYSGEVEFAYKVNLVLLLPEKYQSIEVRIQNARWILPTTDERLTLVSCWPPESNTHRVVVVAFPQDASIGRMEDEFPGN